MKQTLSPEITKPQYVVTTDITFAQVDSWYGHCRRDLKMDLIYPEDSTGKCIRALYGSVEADGFDWISQHTLHIYPGSQRGDLQ